MLLLLNIDISKNINLYIIERTVTGYVTSNPFNEKKFRKKIDQSRKE